MSCCWSKAAVDVVDHAFNTEPETFILGPGRSFRLSPRPDVNRSSKPSISIKSVNAAAQVDFPDEVFPKRVQKRFSTKRQVSTIAELLLKPQDSSATNTNGITLITVDASCDSAHKLDADLLECRTESHNVESCLLHTTSKDEASVIKWDARLSSNVGDHGSKSFFPIIVNLENGELFAFNNNQLSLQEHESHAKAEWLAMPAIDFLPNDVVDVMAGEGGLLCVNGGNQPRKRNAHTPPIPHAEDYNQRLYPPQSILVVCNPLTEEIKFLPRHTNKKLDNKIACLEVLKSNPPSGHGDTKSRTRLRYRVHVVGAHHERSNLRGPGSDELILMTYDSRSDSWISGMAVRRARIPPLSKTGIASQEDGFYLGGQEESDEVKIMKGDPERMKGIKRMSHRQHQAAAGFRSRRVWINKIFYVQASTLKWHSVDFEILGEDGLPHLVPLQAPRVVQCRAGGPVYAVTRAREAARTIEIYEVVIVNGFPTGEFNPVTKMPGDIFMNLFESEASMRDYDCAAGHNCICFLVGPPNQSTLGVCDLRQQKWFMTIFPSDPNDTGRYALSKCQWNPNWKAKP